MALSSPPHPALSVRPLLSTFDTFVTDSQLEALYDLLESATLFPTPRAFRTIFPAIRQPYKDRCTQIETKFDIQALQADRDKQDLLRQIEIYATQFERAEQDKRDLLRQIESHAMQLERTEQDKRDLIQHIQRQAEASKLSDEAHERELDKYRAERADAIANERQSILIFQNHLLQSPRLQPPKLHGSMTRATTWRQAKDTHKYSKRALPVNHAVSRVLEQRCAPLVQQLLTKQYPDETFMYGDFLALFAEALTDKASYHDTSHNPYLTGLEPDLTLALHGVRVPNSVSVLVVVEVKKRNCALGTDGILGQLLDYLVALAAEQEGRRFFTGVVSNVSQNLVVTLEVTGTGCALVEHHPSNIYETLAYLHETSLIEHSHRPPTLGFSPSLGPMEKRLGNTRESVVGQFTPPNQHGALVAVKRGTTASVEIALLRSFRTAFDPPVSIPTLVYEADDHSEFGITPVGVPLVPGSFANIVQARGVIYDIHSALTWIHKLGIVHRDVRCDNVIINEQGRGVLIDFGAAVSFRRGSLRIWSGGYISCPPRLIREVHRHGWLKTYAPSAADDWHAFVLMVNCLVFPTTFVGFQSNLVGNPNTTEARRLLRLWESMENSVVWGPFVDAAANGRPELLANISDAFVWL